jgi:VIT1/CCC1 family predicted Fe2+/Mn2+ transporter
MLDVLLAAFPLWILPSWYLMTFLAGAGGMYESPRAIAANSLFQAVVVALGLLVNLVALLIARDRSIALVLAAVLLSAVLAYMGWYTSVFGVPGT